MATKGAVPAELAQRAQGHEQGSAALDILARVKAACALHYPRWPGADKSTKGAAHMELPPAHTKSHCLQHPAHPPKQNRGRFFFFSSRTQESLLGQAGWGCRSTAGLRLQSSRKQNPSPQLQGGSQTLRAHPRAGCPAPQPRALSRTENRGVGGDGFFPKLLPP